MLDAYLWGQPDSDCPVRAWYMHLTRPSSSCEGWPRQTTPNGGGCKYTKVRSFIAARSYETREKIYYSVMEKITVIDITSPCSNLFSAVMR